ncbi:MFS transporter [Streptomyces lydicus]
MGGTTLSERVERSGPPVSGTTTAPAAHDGAIGIDETDRFDRPEEPAPGVTAPAGPRRVRLAVLALMPALLLAALGQTVVTTALPEIADELHGPDTMSRVVTSYLLAAAIGLPLHGKLGDLFGRKPVILLALLVFTAGSTLAGWSRTMDELVAFRALQGVGGGGLLIGVQAVIADVVPPRARGRFLGLTGAAFGLAAVAGPLIGGLCTDHASWRWCFYLNVPFGVLSLLVLALGLKLPRPVRRARPDIAGALLLAAFATCLALLASWGGTQYAWNSRVVLGLGAGALGCAVLFLAVEHVVAAPLIPLRLFRDSVFHITGLTGAVIGLALFGTAGYLPAFLERAGGATATESGLLMLPLTGSLVLASLVSGRLISRTGHYRAFPVLGCALAGAGMWLLSRMPQHTAREVCGLWTGLLGLGIGLVLPVLVLAVRSSVRAPGPGTATGATHSFRQLGGSVGAALFGALLADRLARGLGDRPPARPSAPESFTPHLVRALPASLRDSAVAAYAHAVPGIFFYLVPMLLLGLVLAFFLKEKPLVSHASPAPQTSPTPHAAPHAPYGDPADPAAVPPARSTADATAPSTPSTPNTSDSRATYPRTHGYGSAGAPPVTVGVPVCGTVQHHDGSIVPRAALTLIDVTGRQVGRGATGDDGRYALSTPGAGSYVLIAAAGGHQPQAVTVTVGERPVELDVVLGGAGRLAGTVTTADGTPVREAMVTLTDVRGEVVATTRSGREGGYVIGELVAGEYTLASSAPAFRPAALPVTVQASRETRQDIELAGGAVLRGTVRAGGGRPVEDARVTLLDAAGNVVDTATTGSDGLFRFVDLSAGEYTVIAAGYPPVATVLRMAGGGRTERDLQLGHED